MRDGSVGAVKTSIEWASQSCACTQAGKKQRAADDPGPHRWLSVDGFGLLTPSSSAGSSRRSPSTDFLDTDAGRHVPQFLPMGRRGSASGDGPQRSGPPRRLSLERPPSRGGVDPVFSVIGKQYSQEFLQPLAAATPQGTR